MGNDGTLFQYISGDIVGTLFQHIYWPCWNAVPVRIYSDIVGTQCWNPVSIGIICTGVTRTVGILTNYYLLFSCCYSDDPLSDPQSVQMWVADQVSRLIS